MADLVAFQWTGIDASGKRTRGVIQSVDNKSAETDLKKMGIEVISLEVKKKAGLPHFQAKKKIVFKDILLFTRYISTMLSADLPIMQALEVISKDQTNPAMQTMIVDIRNNIAEGKTLAESFSKYPLYFNDLYCNLIRAGERSGTLNKSLIRLSHYLERSDTLRRKIKKALIYPIAILTISMIVSLVLLLFVVPQFQTLFKSFGADLPFFTRIFVKLSDFLRSYWWMIAAALVGIIFWIRHLLKTSEKVKLFKDTYLLKVYIIGPMLRKGIIARFTRTLATTLEAGMPIVESMKAMPEIMGNRIYSKAIVQISEDVEKGKQLSTAMSATKLFPIMAIQMIGIGEVSGSLPGMLNKVADTYEEEVNGIVDNLSSLLEPVIMLLLGLIVGSFVIAMYLPIFKLGSVV